MAETLQTSKRWYAVHTRSKWEDKVCKSLEKKGIDHFYPYYVKRIGLRNEKEALFGSSLLFIYASEDDKKLVAKTPGVKNFIYWLNRPAVITPGEIEGIKHFLDYFSSISIERIAVNNNLDADWDSSYSRNHNFDLRDGKYRLSLPSLGFMLEGKPVETNKQQVGTTRTYFRYRVAQDTYHSSILGS